MAEQPDAFAPVRTQLLERAAGADWPELLVEGVGRVAGAVGWTVAVEAATATELILLTRLLFEPAAEGGDTA